MTRTNAATKPPASKPGKAGARTSAARGTGAAARPTQIKRRHLRFRPDPLEHALLQTRDLGGPFTPELIALVSEEAPMGGCGLVLLDTPRLRYGDVCRVQVGRIDPLRAQVVWRQECAPGIVRVGLKFLE